MEILWLIVGAFILACLYYYFLPEDKLDEKIYGKRKVEMICPHCQTKGKVHTKPVTKKAGVSGGKATAAILTGGVSLLAVGLSRENDMTEAHCVKCESTWTF